MKFKNFIKIIILCVSIGVTAFSAEHKTLGTEIKEYGKVYNKDGVLVVHKK